MIIEELQNINNFLSTCRALRLCSSKTCQEAFDKAYQLYITVSLKQQDLLESIQKMFDSYD